MYTFSPQIYPTKRMVSGNSQDLLRHTETINNFINDKLTVQYFAEQILKKRLKKNHKENIIKMEIQRYFLYSNTL